MIKYDRDPLFLHPAFYKNLDEIYLVIRQQLPPGYDVRVISGHRTPQDQFELYKGGREFRNGAWTKVGSVVTNIDGYSSLSRHNYLPALAIDIGIFRSGGSYEDQSELYACVKAAAYKFGFDWGGDWVRFSDPPHIEIPDEILFKKDPEKDTALQWQKYLFHAGAYTKALDGIFGNESQSALEKMTGSRIRSVDAWKSLFDAYGAVHLLPGFEEMTFIPKLP